LSLERSIAVSFKVTSYPASSRLEAWSKGSAWGME